MSYYDENAHQFHIPVMGTAFTIDAPIKVARFGISSVVSIGDDELCETMRAHYCKEYDVEFVPIQKFETDYRARRITAYLNLMHDIVQNQAQRLKMLPFEEGSELNQYFEMLPPDNPLVAMYQQMLRLEEGDEKLRLQAQLRASTKVGSIDVNIMTKLDRSNYDKDGQLMADEYSDALSALRGYAQSKLQSSIVFSAGFNRRLYAYVEKFKDFFPNELGEIKKKIILKVSDFRSSLTQGKFFAKKGIWVSEHRIESGLNCGGHAFATDGLLLGPILEEFKQKKDELVAELFKVCNEALAGKGVQLFKRAPKTKVTVQGGIGTAKEQQFLMSYYGVDGTGWATPFLLVPEVTVVDDATRQRLADAKSEDLYLSGISPLGVPFNTVRGTASEIAKWERAQTERPGSPCPKGHLVSNTEFTVKPICTASTTYQRRKLAALQEQGLPADALEKARRAVLDKACLCEDLAAPALLSNDIVNKRSLTSAVCPGPNLAYFSRLCSLSEMIGHIYGKWSVMNDLPRSNMFISELKMYIDYWAREALKVMPSPDKRQRLYLQSFVENLKQGIAYYKVLIPKITIETEQYRQVMRDQLQAFSEELDRVVRPHHGMLQES